MKSVLVNLSEQLRRFYNNKPVFVQTQKSVNKAEWQSMSPQWVLGRGMCMYHCENLGHVPRNKRNSALDSQLKIWSPFSDTGHHSVWSGEWVMVWFWDNQSLDFDAAIDHHEDWIVVPETIFLQRHNDGIYLQECQEGFELQYWQQGVLLDSLWQAIEPDEPQLLRFGQRLGVDSIHTISRCSPVLQPLPWVVSVTPVEWLERNEKLIAVSCVLLMSVALVWQETRIWKTEYLTRQISAQLEEMQQELTPLLAARNDLQISQKKNRVLTDLINTSSQAYLMTLVSNKIPHQDALFREWHYQQGELRFVVEDLNLDPIEYVRSLQSEPRFSQVQATQARGKNRIQITLRVAR